MATVFTKEQFDELYALFAVLANLERVDKSGDAMTLSLTEINNIGTQGLNIMDEATEQAVDA